MKKKVAGLLIVGGFTLGVVSPAFAGGYCDGYPPPPPPSSCHETVNPAGNPAVGDNGFPNDEFGGDAVPGGTSTSPGVNGNGPINSDGFYLVNGLIFSDDTPIPYPGGGFSWPTTAIKYTEVGGNGPPKVTDNIGGPNSVVKFHIQA